MSFHVHLGVWSEKCLVYLVAGQSDIDTQAERIIKEGMRETDFHPGSQFDHLSILPSPSQLRSHLLLKLQMYVSIISIGA